jgi:hypothetical protein
LAWRKQWILLRNSILYKGFKMTEYTKEDYLKACEALWDRKPTEYLDYKIWRIKPRNDDFCPPSPTWAKEHQWRATDPTREYKEAFAGGRLVQSRATFVNNWINENDGWLDCGEDCAWSADYEYRIVEPKTVKLYPFAKFITFWQHAGYFATIEDAKKQHHAHIKIAPINPDGSVEVEV